MKFTKDFFRTTVSVLVGNAVLAFGVAAFVAPTGVIMGGATGIALVLTNFFPLDISAVVMVLNVAFLFFGLFVLGRKFFIATIASSLLYPAYLWLFQRIPGIESLTADPLCSALFAGLLSGIALGLVMRVGVSTGGVDALDLALNKWTHIPISVAVNVVDLAILLLQVPFSDSEQILYGIVLIVIETIVIDRVVLLGQAQVQLTIISRKIDVLREKFLVDLNVGVTMLHIETGLTRQQNEAMLCIISSRRLHEANRLVERTDPEAFLIVSQVRQVYGRGFTAERIYLRKTASPPNSQSPSDEEQSD